MCHPFWFTAIPDYVPAVTAVARPLYWTPEQAERALHLTAGRVCQLIKEGAMPARKRGRRWVIDPADVRAYLAALPAAGGLRVVEAEAAPLIVERRRAPNRRSSGKQ